MIAVATTVTSKPLMITTFIIKYLFSNKDIFRFFQCLPKAASKIKTRNREK